VRDPCVPRGRGRAGSARGQPTGVEERDKIRQKHHGQEAAAFEVAFTCQDPTPESGDSKTQQANRHYAEFDCDGPWRNSFSRGAHPRRISNAFTTIVLVKSDFRLTVVMPRRRDPSAGSVFINCPFDKKYWPIFEAITFAVVACRFEPRSALEELDSGTIRLTKIQRIIGRCRFGIHDLSRVQLSENDLPRFNMPFELGLDIAAKAFGTGPVKRKQFLILDSVPYRYQQFISDISGQDIKCHDGSPDRAIDVVRNWLRNVSRRPTMGPVEIRQRYKGFVDLLPELCRDRGLDREDIQFVEYVEMARQSIARRRLTR
jgi:hypothetical protein